jgi:hypothetical protein
MQEEDDDVLNPNRLTSADFVVGLDGEWSGGYGGYGGSAVWSADTAGDGHLPQGATHFAQGPAAMNIDVQVIDALGYTTNSKTIAQMKVDMAEKINSTGANLWAMTDQLTTDLAEYKCYENLFGLDLFKANKDDVHQRLRHILKHCHPDKHHDKPMEIQEYAANVTRRFIDAKEAFLLRFDAVFARHIPRPQATEGAPYQELQDEFVAWLLHHYDTVAGRKIQGQTENPLDFLFCTTGSIYYQPQMAHVEKELIRELFPEATDIFFNMLLENPEEATLLDILRDFLPDRFQHHFDDWYDSDFRLKDNNSKSLKIGIFLMRIPHNFPSWIAKELDKIRALNMHLELHIIGGLDVWPADWESCLKYGDSFWFDKRLFGSFWKGRTLLNPPVFTVAKAGISPIKLLKKMYIARLTTEDMTPQDCVIYNEDTHCDWQASGFLDAYFMKCIKFNRL